MLIGCFGKLPLSPEFIKHNATGPAFRGLDQWFQEGIAHSRSQLGQSWTEDFLQADTWNFIFHGPEENEYLVGVASPNRDRAGRTFPFFVFLRVDRAQFLGPSIFSPIYFGEFLQEAKEVVESGWKEIDLPTFRSKVQSLTMREVPDLQFVEEQYKDYLRAHSDRWLLKACLGEHHTFPDGGLVKALRNHVASNGDLSASLGGAGIKFPIRSETHGNEFEIPFWIDLATRLFEQDQGYSHVFWVSSPQQGKPYMLLTFRRPSAKNFLGLVKPDSEKCWWDELIVHENVEEVDQFTGSDQDDQETQRIDVTGLDEPEHSLASLLEEVRVHS